MTYTVKKLNLSRIYLDNDNPRHDPIENESEIISHLISNEKVKPLARHISNIGGISPLERVGVVPHPKVKDAYITAEGNRRICAIKLLADPDKADTEANKKYFRGLAANMESRPTSLEAVVFIDKKVARPWISLRHEGEQKGVGTKGWDSQQITRFNSQGGGSTNPNIQSSLLIDYARAKKLLSSDQIDILSITTLTRYLSNPIFRDVLGLVDNKSLKISVPVDEFDHAVTRFLSDAIDPLNKDVNSRTTVKQRKEYAEKLRDEGVAPVNRGREPVDVNEPANREVEVDNEDTEAKTKRNNRSPDKRSRVVPKEFSARINNKILKRLFDELRSVDPGTHTFAATYLLRAVIEQTATLFLTQNGKAPAKELHNKLASVAELLAKQGMEDRELKVLRTMASDKDSRYSPDTIGHFVHGGAVPTRVDTIKTWDSIEKILQVLFEQLK